MNQSNHIGRVVMRHVLPHLNRRLSAGICAVVLLLASLMPQTASALQGAYGSHDPSRIIRGSDGKFHVWSTGQGITHMTSTDLVNWTAAAPVFGGNGMGPAWVTGYAPGFTGFYWAPDVVYYNGKYYMYWCAAGANQGTVIGLSTSTDLNTWTDQGPIHYSVAGSPFLAIDACPFIDSAGSLWITYGSHLSGIFVMKMDSNGKGIGSTIKNVASSGADSEHEGPFCFYKNGYYYMFWNRGYFADCCNYNIQMARATSPSGPYYDASGRAVLGTGYGTSYAATGSFFRSPCHMGYSQGPDGAEYSTFSTWDDTRGGATMLHIARLAWSGGWPVYSPNWIANDNYAVQNVGNGMVWDDWGCTGANSQAIAQNYYSALWCQRWNFTHLGGGTYKIALSNGRVADVFNNSASAGAKLDIYDSTGCYCQQWKIDRYSTGSYCLQSVNGMLCVDVPNATTAPGTQLGMWYGNGSSAQKWTVWK